MRSNSVAAVTIVDMYKFVYISGNLIKIASVVKYVKSYIIKPCNNKYGKTSNYVEVDCTICPCEEKVYTILGSRKLFLNDISPGENFRSKIKFVSKFCQSVIYTNKSLYSIIEIKAGFNHY